MFDFGFFRNPYVGRSFISPSQELRDLKVLCKFNPMEHTLKGRDGEPSYRCVCSCFPHLPRVVMLAFYSARSGVLAYLCSPHAEKCVVLLLSM